MSPQKSGPPRSFPRLAFWTHALSDKEIAAITPDDVDVALLALAERGCMKGGKRSTTAAGKPLAGASASK